MPVKTTRSESATMPPARQESPGAGPFRTLERFADEVTRIVDPILGDLMTWAPRVDVTRHENELLIRADLPGLAKDDVEVNVTGATVTIHLTDQATASFKNGVLEIRVPAAPRAEGRPLDIAG